MDSRPSQDEEDFQVRPWAQEIHPPRPWDESPDRPTHWAVVRTCAEGDVDGERSSHQCNPRQGRSAPDTGRCKGILRQERSCHSAGCPYQRPGQPDFGGGPCTGFFKFWLWAIISYHLWIIHRSIITNHQNHNHESLIITTLLYHYSYYTSSSYYWLTII